MPYTPFYQSSGGWQAGTTTPVTAAALNTIETEYTEAVNSFEQDLLTPFVLSGLVCTKDGTTASQLDVTAGVALIKQSADSTLRRRAPAATNFSTTGNPSTTMYLDLNADGTWSWGTAHSTQSNYLAICQVTTDASANISAVADERTINTTLFSGMAGAMGVPGIQLPSGAIDPSSATGGGVSNFAAVNAIVYKTQQSGAAQGHAFGAWDGSANVVPLSIGGQFANALSYVSSTGKFSIRPSSGYDALVMYAVPGSAYVATLGVGDPSFGAGTGLYAYDDQGGDFIFKQGTKNGILFTGAVTASSGCYANVFGGSVAGDIWYTTHLAGASNALHLQAWDGSAAHDGVVVQGNGSVQIGTIRNGATTLARIFTGANTPSSPNVGDIWIQA